MSQTHCHIRRQKYGDALCGPCVGCVYVILGRDGQIPETEFPICIPCAALHIEEHYSAMSKAQSAHPN